MLRLVQALTAHADRCRTHGCGTVPDFDRLPRDPLSAAADHAPASESRLADRSAHRPPDGCRLHQDAQLLQTRRRSHPDIAAPQAQSWCSIGCRGRLVGSWFHGCSPAQGESAGQQPSQRLSPVPPVLNSHSFEPTGLGENVDARTIRPTAYYLNRIVGFRANRRIRHCGAI